MTPWDHFPFKGVASIKALEKGRSSEIYFKMETSHRTEKNEMTKIILPLLAW